MKRQCGELGGKTINKSKSNQDFFSSNIKYVPQTRSISVASIRPREAMYEISRTGPSVSAPKSGVSH